MRPQPGKFSFHKTRARSQQIYSLLRKLKWQIPGESLAAQYNWCQGPVLGHGLAVEKHCSTALFFKLWAVKLFWVGRETVSRISFLLTDTNLISALIAVYLWMWSLIVSLLHCWLDLCYKKWCRALTTNLVSHSMKQLSDQLKSLIFWADVTVFTPWCRVLLEKLTGLQLVKKFPIFYGTRRFITALTSLRHSFLSWASPIQYYTHIPPPGDHS